MKNACWFILLCCLTVMTVHARILTVSNMAGRPAQYTTLLDAVGAALPNDTLYIHGSTLPYGDITLNAPLVLIGTGHNPQKQSPLTAVLNRIQIQSFGTTQLVGLTVGSIDVVSSFSTDTLRIKRCRFVSQPQYGALAYNGGGTLIVEGNVFTVTPGFTTILYYGPSQIVIQNNVINGPIVCDLASTTSPALIANNVFVGLFEAFPGLRNAAVTNNIFYTTAPFGFNPQHQSVMHHNISYNNSYGAFPQPFDDPALTNLMIDPLFVNVTNGNGFDYSFDYHLRSDSPGRLMGSDGKDVGLYGGDEFIFSTTGEPGISTITEFSITSPTTIPPGGTLQIHINTQSIR